METLERRKAEEEQKALIEQYVEETIDSIVFGNFSVRSLRKFHQEVNERNRQIAHGECTEELDTEAWQLMHQVTKHVIKAVGTQQGLNVQRAHRSSIRLRNSVVE